MSDTAITTSLPTTEPVPVSNPAQPRGVDLGRLLWRGLKFTASLELTVGLFLLSLILVFCGTLAQVDAGIWTVVDSYFRTGLVWVPFQTFARFGQVFFGLPVNLKLPGSFPFPGGWTIGSLLLVNLLAAHLVRFKVSWKRSGILLIHSGLIVMMLGELITGLWAVEAKMTIGEGETVHFVDVNGDFELALTDSTDPKEDDVVVVPGRLLRRGGLIQHEQLPVDVEVLEYSKNSDLLHLRDGEEAMTDAVAALDGRFYRLTKRGEEKGTDPNQREDAALVRVAFKKKGTDQVIGTYRLSLWFYPNFVQRQVLFPPQQLVVGDRTYGVELRLKRVYKPYSLYLIDFRHEVYPGTDVPKDFSSQVRLLDPGRKEDRQVRIWMNNPLFYGGETFYQSGYLPGDKGTVLQVVRNPGWQMPYISCLMVTVGMLVHFGMHLSTFLQRRLAS